MIKRLLIISTCQIVIGSVISLLRYPCLEQYIKDRGYKFKKRSLKIKLSETGLVLIHRAIPLWGSFIALISLFSSDEAFFNQALEMKRIERETKC